MIRFLLSLVLCGLLSLSPAGAAPTPRATGGCTLSNPLPLDAGVAGAIEAHGTCALTKAWLNGKFADVVSNGVTYTIYFVNGAPDTRRLAQLMGNINPNVGMGGLPLAKWYDQIGTNDCVQATAANRMSVWLINGVVWISADGYFINYLSATADKYCRAPSTSINGQAATFYFSGRLIQGVAPAMTTGGSYTLAQTGPGCCGGGAGAGYTMGGGNNFNAQANIGAFDWNTFSGPTMPQLWPESQPAVIAQVLGPGNVTVTQNEESSTCAATCPLSAQTTTGLSIGADISQSGKGAYAGYQSFIVFNSALSAGNQTTIRTSLYTLHGIAKTQSYSVISDGASFDISQGGLVGGVNGEGWTEQMRSRIPYPIRFTNTAVSGATIAQLNTAWSTMTAFPCTGSFSKVVYIGPSSAAGNSINGGRTGAQAFSDMSTLLTTVKTKCPSITNIVVSTTTGGGEFANYAAAVRSNAVGLGYTVVDLAADPIMGNSPNGPPLVNGGGAPYSGHPTIFGHAYLATDYLGAVRTAIGQ